MKKNGFSLIELVLAIFILTMAVFSSFALIQRITSFAFASQNKLTAYYLAQEGIENARNIRDNNWLKGEGWTTGLPTTTEPLVENNLLDKFTRTTTANLTEDGYLQVKYLQVKVVVSWTEHGLPQQIAVLTNLYNWYESEE
ncbi:MAG: type IV pilus modification PilV family protein [Minisyncoccales bacterium]